MGTGMRWIRYGLNLVIAIYLLALMALVLPPLVGFHIYAVISPSMAPRIPTGSAVYVKERSFEEIQIGDVITYCLPGGEVGEKTYVTHRIVSFDAEKQTFRVKGDANETEDGADVPYQSVMGTVRCTLPYLGYAAALIEGAQRKLYLAGAFLWLMAFRTLTGGDIPKEKTDRYEEEAAEGR